MSGRQRVLDPSLANLVSSNDDGVSGRGSMSRNRRLARPSGLNRPPRRRVSTLSRTRHAKKRDHQDDLSIKLKAALKQIENEITALTSSKDPYTFEASTKKIQGKLNAHKLDFALPENQEQLSSELLSLQQDESTIKSRLAELEEERQTVASGIKSTRELIQTLTGQLNQAKMDLRGLQNRSDAIGKFVSDSRSEQEMIQHNLQTKRVQLIEMEEQMSSRSKSLQLISDSEQLLQKVSAQFVDVQKTFLSDWRNWTVQQMVIWMCEQDSAYEQYRNTLDEQLPAQAESGADFAYFDTNILLGLGIGKIRHRGELMKSITQLVS